MSESVLSRSLTIEQKVACLARAVDADVKKELHRFLAVTDVALESGLKEARGIIEVLIRRILLEEGLEADRDLNNNIEILGGKDGKFPARRRKTPNGPIPPPILPTPLYSSLHNLRIYGNQVVHKSLNEETREIVEVRLTTLDLQVVLGQIMRLVEWYFQEYPRGPRIDPLYDRLPEPIVARYGEAPPDPARFLGRDAEVDGLRVLLRDPATKLVTVLAPAGMGKTLLTSRVALELAGQWHSGRGCLLWFDLKAAPSFGEITARILASFQPDGKPADLAIAQLSPSARVGQIVRALAEQPVLLILDNFESWLDPRTRKPVDPNVTELLNQVMGRRHRGQVVLTSRVAVDVPGIPEAVSLKPLSLADSSDLLLKEGVSGSEATVAVIRTQLGGNPRLLIMLAEVLLRRRVRSLDDGLRRSPELVNRAADGLLAEVWRELPERAQLVLKTMAVLRPPVPLDDLVGVLAQLDAGVADCAADVLWDDLRPRALVLDTEDGTAFAFEHLLIRDYALKQWANPAQAHRAAIAHYQSVLAARPADGGLDPAHLDLIRHALAVADWQLAAQTLTDSHVKELMLRDSREMELLELLRPLQAVAGALPLLLRLQTLQLLARVLDHVGDYPGAVEHLEVCRAQLGEWYETHEGCQTLNLLSSVLRKMQRYEEAEAHGKDALRIARGKQLPEDEAWALFALSNLERNCGRPGKATLLAKDGLKIADELQHPTLRLIGRILHARTLTGGGGLERARQLYEEALTLADQLGRLRSRAQLLQSLADIARRQTRNDEAMTRVNEAIDVFQRIGDRTGEGIARHCRGLVIHQLGKSRGAEAVEELRHALRLALDLGHPREVASVLSGLGRVYQGDATLLSITCWQTAWDLHVKMGHNWKKAQRSLQSLREEWEKGNRKWAEAEERLARERFALLEEATGISRPTWERLLDCPTT